MEEKQLTNNELGYKLKRLKEEQDKIKKDVERILQIVEGLAQRKR